MCIQISVFLYFCLFSSFPLYFMAYLAYLSSIFPPQFSLINIKVVPLQTATQNRYWLSKQSNTKLDLNIREKGLIFPCIITNIFSISGAANRLLACSAICWSAITQQRHLLLRGQMHVMQTTQLKLGCCQLGFKLRSSLGKYSSC